MSDQKNEHLGEGKLKRSQDVVQMKDFPTFTTKTKIFKRIFTLISIFHDQTHRKDSQL